MKTKEENLIDQIYDLVEIPEYSTTSNEFKIWKLINDYRAEQSQQDKKPVDVEKLREEWNKRSDYIRTKNVNTDEIFNHFLPFLSNTSEDKEAWVSVEERLPENNVDVLVYQKREHHPKFEVCIASYDEKDKPGYKWLTYSHMCEDEDLKVTHWRALPQPPKQD